VITLSFKTNFAIYGGAKFTLAGLVGASTIDQPILRDGSGGEGHDRFMDQVAWDQKSSTLTFQLSGEFNLMADKEYSISLPVDNPDVRVTSGYKAVYGSGTTMEFAALYVPPSLKLKVTDDKPIEIDVENKQDTLGLCGNDGMDAQPMFIYEPAFKMAAVAQTSDIPCDEDNEITVTIKTNMPLCAGSCNSQLTVTGLSGAVLPSGPVSSSLCHPRTRIRMTWRFSRLSLTASPAMASGTQMIPS
jgi:hypothetical protein